MVNHINLIEEIEKIVEQMKAAEKSDAAKLAEQIVDMPNMSLFDIYSKTIGSEIKII